MYGTGERKSLLRQYKNHRTPPKHIVDPDDVINPTASKMDYEAQDNKYF